MKFLVCRSQAIRPNNQVGTSCFPILVEAPPTALMEEVVRKAFDTISPGYIGMHEYIVVPMNDAQIVSFSRRPQPEYWVKVENFNSHV